MEDILKYIIELTIHEFETSEIQVRAIRKYAQEHLDKLGDGK